MWTRYRCRNGATAALREVCEHVGGGVLPIDKDGNVILVRQFRYAFDTELLEMPAGKMECTVRRTPRNASAMKRRNRLYRRTHRAARRDLSVSAF